MIHRIRKKHRGEAAENTGTVRIVARARAQIAAGAPLLPKHRVDRLAKAKKPVRAVWKLRAKR
jgi:hypothetical protein